MSARNDILLTAEELARFARELDSTQLRYAVKGTMRRGASKLKRIARAKLRGVRTSKGAKVHNVGQMARENVRGGVFRDMSGFRVIVKSRGDKYMHKNRRGLEKPVAFWLNSGTQDRMPRSKKGKRHSAGRIQTADYIGEAERTGLQSVIDSLGTEYNREIQKRVKRLGKR